MLSTMTPAENDPHDSLTVAPEVVPASWADKVLADVTRDAGASDFHPLPVAESSAGASVRPSDTPTLDTTFRATDTRAIPAPDQFSGDRPSRSHWAKRVLIGFLFALGSAAAAAAWTHYGDKAQQTIARWTPRFLASSSSPAEIAPSEQPASADTQASAAATASTPPPVPAQPADNVAPNPPSPESSPLLQSTARDVATMQQQIEQLKASIEQLKAGQEQMAREVARAAEVRASVPGPRPRTTIRTTPPATSASRAAPTSRLSTAPPRPARPTLSAAPYTAPPPLSPPAAQPEPQQQATEAPDGGPVVRPPMPLR